MCMLVWIIKHERLSIFFTWRMPFSQFASLYMCYITALHILFLVPPVLVTVRHLRVTRQPVLAIHRITPSIHRLHRATALQVPHTVLRARVTAPLLQVTGTCAKSLCDI